jgi:uncharacterized phage infection (PIP) family protein YhgE
VTATALLAFTACGDDSGSSSAPTPSPTQSSSSAALTWADGFCSSVSDWQQSIDRVRADLKDTAHLSAARLQDDVGQVADSTRAMVTELKDVPDLAAPTADQVRQQLSSLSDQLQHQSATIEQTAGQKPSSVQELLQAVATITGALATMASDITTSAADIRDTVDAADPTRPFETAPACQDLKGK